MYVAVIPNRGSPPAILLRESYREAGKTKNRTLANLSRWPVERIEQLRAVLRGDQLLPAAEAGKSSARCRTATCWQRSALPAASRSTPCCRAARRNAAAIWGWL